MSSTIKIKRSSTANAPTALSTVEGELAYSYGAGAQDNNGDRLFFRTNTAVVTIGGKYFTDMLDHVPGTLTASSALVVNELSKLDNLKVDNLDFNGSAITSLDNNSNITITPNGTGKTVIGNIYVGSDTVSLQEYIEDIAGGAIEGGAGLTSSYVDATGVTTLSVDVDGVSLEINGSDALQVKALGISTGMLADGAVTNAKITNTTIANAKLVNSTISVSGNTGLASDAVSLGETLAITGSGAISTAVSDNALAITVANATTGAVGVASFSSTEFDVSGAGAVTLKTSGIANSKLANSSVTIGTTSVSLGSDITTIDGLTDVVIGDLQFAGNTITSTGNLVVDVSTDVIDFSDAKLTNLGTPTSAADATTKSYVDTAVLNASGATTLRVAGDAGTNVNVTLSADDLNFVKGTNNGISVSAAKTGTEVTVTIALAQDLSTAGAVSFSSATLTNDLAVNGGDITTSVTGTATVFNASATTLNMGGDAIAVNIGAATGLTTINHDLTVAGDLIVSGNTVTVNVETLTVEDPLIALATGNTTNTLDIGFIGAYNDGADKTTGLFRDATDGVYKVFANGTVADNVVTVTTLAQLDAIIDGGTY